MRGCVHEGEHFNGSTFNPSERVCQGLFLFPSKRSIYSATRSTNCIGNLPPAVEPVNNRSWIIAYPRNTVLISFHSESIEDDILIIQ